jgi:hypothetical protein
MPGASPVYSVFLYIEIRDRRPNRYPAGKPVKSLWASGNKRSVRKRLRQGGLQRRSRCRAARIDIEEGELHADFDGREVTYGFGELDELVLAYATTIHKSQGSEYPAVVIPLATQHYPMLQRNLVYTGMGCARTLRSTRIPRSIDLRRQSGASHRSLGSAVSIGTTFGWHNR